MSLVTFKDNKFVFYSCLVKYDKDGITVEEPTNRPSELEQMVNRFPKMSNFRIESITPTQEQQIRLQKVNALENIFDKEGWVSQVSTFVMNGYIDNTFPEFLKNAFYEEYKEQSKKILIEKYKADLAALRYDKEIAGVSYMEKIVKSDRESQATITSTIVLFNTGVIETIDFKCANDEWLSGLTKEQFSGLAKSVSGHVNACFKAEALCIEKLSAMPLEELVKPDGGEVGLNNINLTELFNKTYQEVIVASSLTNKPDNESNQ